MRRVAARRVVAALGLCCLLSLPARALDIRSYYSPRNNGRARRRRTLYIVLHTTEGPAKGSLAKVHRYGEAHYFVEEGGRVYRVVHRSRVAYHAGRSMWNGLTNLDEVSIGIEVVGYHNRDITGKQYTALRDLVSALQRIYRVPDERVLTHSMVAYGAPNRWHRCSHRGRKRCGMLFADRSIRKRLGLTKCPTFDPDVRAGRLVEADPYLARVLYGSAEEQRRAIKRFVSSDADVISDGRSAWDIARDRYNDSDTLYVFPDGTRRRGNQVKDWRRIPPGTRVVLGAGQRENASVSLRRIGGEGRTAQDIAGNEVASRTTVYFLPDGTIRLGSDLSAQETGALPRGTGVLVGYMSGGAITARRSAFDICGTRWNSPLTYYRLPDGALVPGDKMRERAIPAGTRVFYVN